MKSLFDHPTVYTKPTDSSLKKSMKASKLLHKKAEYLKSHESLMAAKKEIVNRENERRPLFFMIGLSLSLLLVSIAFNWKSPVDSGVVDLGDISDDFEEIMEVPLSKQPPPPPPKQLEVFNIQVVDDAEIIEEVEVNLDVEISQDVGIEDVVYDDAPIIAEIEEEKAEQIFQIVEDRPTFPGGISSFYTYVAENINYPPAARRLHVSGRVFVQFVIEKDGTPSQVQVVKGIGMGCDEEAVRVIENSPRWNPGKQRGHPVRVYMTLPINFVLHAN